MRNFWKEARKPLIGLAPMDGVTDEPARQVQVKIAKPDVLYTEFVSAEGYCRKPSAFEKTLSFQENERPIVAQVFGYTPEAFYETVGKIGCLDFDGIDLNMGCPARKVLGRGGGGALIGNCQQTAKIIESSLKALKEAKSPIPLSIKTRLGQNEPITEEWIGFLAQYPISEITVHGRLLKQGCSGPVNWPEIEKGARVARQKGIVYLGNGGVKSIPEARQKAQEYGLDGILIAQAALGNPWVFKTDYQPSQKEILDTILAHAQITQEFYPPERFLTVLKHLGWYPRGFRGSKELRRQLLKTRSYQEVKAVIEKFPKEP